MSDPVQTPGRSRVVVTWTVEYEADWLPTTEDDKDYAVEILMEQVPQEVTFHDGGEFHRDWTPVGWMVASEATGDMQMGTMMALADPRTEHVRDVSRDDIAKAVVAVTKRVHADAERRAGQGRSSEGGE